MSLGVDEANRSDFDPECLVLSTDVADGNVGDWQSNSFVCCVGDDCLGPVRFLVLETEKIGWNLRNPIRSRNRYRIADVHSPCIRRPWLRTGICGCLILREFPNRSIREVSVLSCSSSWSNRSKRRSFCSGR